MTDDGRWSEVGDRTSEIGGQDVGKAKRAEGEKMTVQGDGQPGETAELNSTS